MLLAADRKVAQDEKRQDETGIAEVVRVAKSAIERECLRSRHRPADMHLTCIQTTN